MTVAKSSQDDRQCDGNDDYNSGKVGYGEQIKVFSFIFGFVDFGKSRL